MFSNKAKKIVGDISNNVIASFVQTGVAQLLVYPMLAYYFGDKEYGILLAIIGMINTVSTSLGISLNNVRLLEEKEYQEKKIEGDFQILLFASTIVGCIMILGYSALNSKGDWSIVICSCILVVLQVCKSYYMVTFRLNLEYKKNTVLSVISAVGLIIGLFISKYMNWCWAFITSEIFALAYLMRNNTLYKENFSISSQFNKTLKKYVILVVVSFVGNVTIYLDRLLLLPILGSVAVSTYTVAAFMGKSMGIVMGPIANVMLSYYSIDYISLDKRKFKKINNIIYSLAIVFFVICCLFGPSFTLLLYPKIAEYANPFLRLASLASILGIVGSMIQPAVLKYAPLNYQIVIQATYGGTYLLLGCLLSEKFEIYGFCVSQICVNLIKVIMLLHYGNKFIQDERRSGNETKTII